jgi:hypothetical protein
MLKMIVPDISASKVAGLIGLHKFQKPAEVIYGLLMKDAASKAVITQMEEAHQRRPFHLVANELTRDQPIVDIIFEGLRQCRTTKNVQSVLRNVEDQANIVFDLRYPHFEPAVRTQLVDEIKGKVSRKRGLDNEDSILNQYEAQREVKVTERNTKTIKKSFETFRMVGRCDGYVASESRIVDSKDRTRMWPNVPLYDEIQLRCYMNMYNAKESELIERFPDGTTRHTLYPADDEKWTTLQTAVEKGVEKLRVAMGDGEELKRIVYANTVVVHSHGDSNAAAAPPSMDL